MNNFQRLEEEQINLHPHASPEIERNVIGNMRIVKMVGDIIELYLPKVWDLFVAFTGGKPEVQAEAEHQPDALGNDTDDAINGHSID